MKSHSRLKFIIPLSILVSLCILVSFCLMIAKSMNAQGFSYAGAEISEEDIVGKWSAVYDGESYDTILLFPEGTYQQTYVESAPSNYKYGSDINNWYLEYLEDEGIYLHLESGRYYLAGTSYFENQGWGNPYLYDPFSRKLVHPKDELILVVLYDQSNNLILHHLWTNVDQGFPVFRKDQEYFTHK